MKTFKKILAGLGLLVAVVCLFSIFSHRAFAATINPDDFANYQYAVTGFSNGKVDTLKVTIGGKDYFFIDKDTSDNNNNLKYYGKAGPICGMTQDQGEPMYGITITGNPVKDSSGQAFYPANMGVGYSGDTAVDCTENSTQKVLPKTDISIFYNTSLQGAPAPTGTAEPSTATAGIVNCDPNTNSNCVCSSQGCTLTSNTSPSGNDGTTGSCDSNFNSGFSWIICPGLELADQAIGAAYGQVEAQLCFKTTSGSTSSTGSSVVCGKGGNTLSGNVKNSWNIFKNIASALLVIAMLAMIISQAIGGGPFDAYTVRKMLPKLVAAVIIMQLSWVLLKYAVDISNDVGSAIGNLMMAPFGGPDNMDLAKLIGHGVNVATGSKPAADAFTVFGGIAGIAGAYYAIPALPLLALYVFTGVFIAFFVLILRKLLIIMLVILAPIAFVAWVMPGTERYWKMWRDNFVKLLTMFPLIMAMLSAGRIFAYITSTAGSSARMFSPHLAVAHLGPMPVPYVASVTGFADLAIIIGAFFAPYFLLPKTFSWGGQLLGAAGKAVENYANKGAEPAKKLFKDREESYRGERRRKSQMRVARNEDFNWRKPWQKPVDLLKSGKLDPTYGLNPYSRRRQQAVTKYVAQGAEAEQQEVKEADLRAGLLFDQVDDHDGLARAMARGDSNYRYETHEDKAHNQAHGLTGDARRTHRLGRISRADRQAGLNGVAKFGGGSNFRFLDREVDRLRHGDREERAMAKSFLDANAQALIPKMKHLYYGEERDTAVSAMVGSMSENSFVGMEGAEMEAIVESLSQRATHGATQQIRAGAAQDLSRVLTFYQAAINNDNIRPNISSGVNQAVEALVDGQNLVSINGRDPQTGQPIIDPDTNEPRGRARFQHDGIDPAAAGAGPVAPLVQSLHGRIDGFGNVEPQVPPPGPPVGVIAGAGAPAAGGGGAGAGQPNTRVPAADLDTPDAAGWTPRQDALAENATRNEYNAYRARVARSTVDPVAYPPLTPAEQQRYEQIGTTYPDW